MKRAITTTVALLAAGFTAIQLAPQAVGQTGPGWTPLFDGKVLGDWTAVGNANWRVEDGAIVGRWARVTSKSPSGRKTDTSGAGDRPRASRSMTLAI